jgi:hypothetical protein
MTCTIIGLVVACSGTPVQTTPAQSLALMREHAIEIIDAQTPERPAGVTRRDTPEEALALMKQHETKAVDVRMLDILLAPRPYTPSIQWPRRKFGENPWWWSELYDSWWYEPWVLKPWQEQPLPQPCCGW